MLENTARDSQLRGYLDLVVEHLKAYGILEIKGGNACVRRSGTTIPADEIKRLISMGHLTTKLASTINGSKSTAHPLTAPPASQRGHAGRGRRKKITW